MMSTNRLRLLVFAAVSIVVIMSAWLCDDAYHGLVMAKHLASGDGLVYNIGERVNASTCPLFTLIIAGVYSLFMNGMYLVAISVCLVFSLICIYLILWKVCRDNHDVILFALLFCSKSFVSYTTSGLENPLLYLLGILFFLLMFRHNEGFKASELFMLSLLSGLIAMTRMDNVLIYLPFLLYSFFIKKNEPSRIKTIIIGFIGVLPFIAWEIFSLFYYGFLFPNTAYMKLGSNILPIYYILKGFRYVLSSFLMDPVVIIIPCMYILIGLFMARDIRHKLLSLGVMLYILYVIRIAGDFMSGRHFTVIYMLSVAGILFCLHDVELKVNWRKIVLITSIVCMMYSVNIGWMAGPREDDKRPVIATTTSDERANYFRHTALFLNIPEYLKEKKLFVLESSNSEVDNIRLNGYKGGIIGFAGGRRVYYNSDLYLQDAYGLGDPLLAHIPSHRYKTTKWVVGHIKRDIPDGYAESVRDGNNQIVNPSLHKYYDIIRLITRGELFSPERLKAIVDINLGRYAYLVSEYLRDTQDK